jgi:antitoxin VapB
MAVAKVFINGKSQAIRLPREYRVEGSTVYVNRVGNAIVLLPINDPWQGLLDSLGKFSDDFMKTREQDVTQERQPL